MLETIIVKTWRQPTGIDIIQSLNVGITTTWIEIFVAPTMDVFWKGVLIGFAVKSSSGLGGILVRRKWSGSMTLPTASNGVVGTP
jgi:hypothetical protein